MADEQVLSDGSEPKRGSAPGKHYNLPLAYLRSFVILLVVAHHAATGYHVIAPASAAGSLAEHMQSMRGISPVLDPARSDLLSLFAAFNDGFFMHLLFLLSGLFVWGSLRRKGVGGFLRSRLIRLGLPLLAMVLLRPLTHYPTYLQSGGSGGFADYWQQWSALEWRGGPIWFLEVLLVFNLLVALLAALKVDFGALGDKLPSSLAEGPFRFYLLLLFLSLLAYVPVASQLGSFYWLQVGPAQVQVDRLLWYALYFAAGIALGAYGIDRSFLVSGSNLSRRWLYWSIAALVTFFVSLVVSMGEGNAALSAALSVLACATICFAMLAIFLRFAQAQSPVFDSLDRNSYGIYVIHYGIVSYLLYAMLGVDLPAMAKWLIVFPAALAICWGLTALLKRIPGVASVI